MKILTCDNMQKKRERGENSGEWIGSLHAKGILNQRIICYIIIDSLEFFGNLLLAILGMVLDPLGTISG